MTEVLIEVVAPPGQMRELGGPPKLEKLRDRIGDVREALSEIADEMTQDMDKQMKKSSGPWAVDEISIDVGLDLKAGAGVIVARAETSVSFNAKIVWRRSGESA